MHTEDPGTTLWESRIQGQGTQMVKTKIMKMRVASNAYLHLHNLSILLSFLHMQTHYVS